MTYNTARLIEDLKGRDDGVCTLAAIRLEEYANTLRLFREFYSFYVTQSKIGSSHHHPIWGDIACILDSADLNNKSMNEKEYRYITGPYFDYFKIREQNEDLYTEEED